MEHVEPYKYYWARTFGSDVMNAIILTGGIKPFLTFEGYDFKSNKVVNQNFQIEEVGSEIIKPLIIK